MIIIPVIIWRMPIKSVVILKTRLIYFIEPSQELKKLITIEAPSQVSGELITSWGTK